MLSPWPRLNGEVPERSNGAVSKTVVPLTGDRGFESLPLRQITENLRLWPKVPHCWARLLRKPATKEHDKASIKLLRTFTKGPLDRRRGWRGSGLDRIGG